MHKYADYRFCNFILGIKYFIVGLLPIIIMPNSLKKKKSPAVDNSQKLIADKTPDVTVNEVVK
ncbi:MAG: hypothetical protein DI598_16430, partial [Pseudopedobacter saltans]